MPPLRLGAAAILLAWFASAPALATPLVPALQERSVFAEAAAEDGPRTSSQSNGDGAEAFEPLDTSVSAAAPADDAEASASSAQTSSLGDDRFDGSGMAAAAASSAAADGLAFSAADSFFLVEFADDGPVGTPFLLQGLLTASGSGDAFARLELEQVVGGQSLFSFEALPGQSVPISETFFVDFGVGLRLLAIASAAQDVLGSGGPSTGSASFQFSLIVIPEPSSLLLVGLAVALLARARRA
jgi:hypothetical protein